MKLMTNTKNEEYQVQDQDYEVQDQDQEKDQNYEVEDMTKTQEYSTKTKYKTMKFNIQYQDQEQYDVINLNKCARGGPVPMKR